MAQNNLGCFRYKFSLLNQVEDYYRNCVIEDLIQLGGTAQYLEKILKLPHGYISMKYAFSMIKTH